MFLQTGAAPLYLSLPIPTHPLPCAGAYLDLSVSRILFSVFLQHTITTCLLLQTLLSPPAVSEAATWAAAAGARGRHRAVMSCVHVCACVSVCACVM